ncbi:hypothetical protein J6590_094800 [Homalodisca vitripennis]|nr:hypothetical protein J6590_094800 [Homalodisca vitripennis]
MTGIEDALFSDISELSELQYSGSEYVPSNSVNSESEDEVTEDEDETINTTALLSSVSNCVNTVNSLGASIQNYGQANDNRPEPSRTTSPAVDEATGSDNWSDCTLTERDFPFTGEEGLMYDFDRSDPMTVYRQFFTDEVLQLTVTETNRNARNYLSSHEVRRRSLMRNWLDCDEI